GIECSLLGENRPRRDGGNDVDAPHSGHYGRIRGTGRYGISDRDDSDQSALMFAARITLPHFSVSSAISLPKSLGEPGRTLPPRSASRALILGSARPALISLFSFSTISAGVALGVPTPYPKLASYPGTNSAKVGMSGSASARIAVVTASARSLPVLMCSIEEGTETNPTCTCPPSKSVSAGATPRYGT